jgi:hypothetical protein
MLRKRFLQYPLLLRNACLQQYVLARDQRKTTLLTYYMH